MVHLQYSVRIALLGTMFALGCGSSEKDEAASDTVSDTSASSVTPDAELTTPTTSTKPTRDDDAMVRALAKVVLEAYRANDWDTLFEVLSPWMKKEYPDQAPADIARGYRKWRKRAVEDWNGEVDAVGYRFSRPEDRNRIRQDRTEAQVVFGKSANGGEYYVVGMVLENGRWWFHKLWAPDTSVFEELAPSVEVAVERAERRAKEPKPAPVPKSTPLGDLKKRTP